MNEYGVIRCCYVFCRTLQRIRSVPMKNGSSVRPTIAAWPNTACAMAAMIVVITVMRMRQSALGKLEP